MTVSRARVHDIMYVKSCVPDCRAAAAGSGVGNPSEMATAALSSRASPEFTLRVTGCAKSCSSEAARGRELITEFTSLRGWRRLALSGRVHPCASRLGPLCRELVPSIEAGRG